MKISACFSSCILCVAVASVSGCARSPTVKPEVASKAVAVKTLAVMQAEVKRTSSQPASVLPYFRAEIMGMVAGYVKQLQVDIGDYVEVGDVLAVIDVPDKLKHRQVMEARVTRAAAEEQRAAAGVELAKAHVRSASARLAQAESEMGRVVASLAAAEAEFSRTRDMVERKSLESRMLDEARKKRDSELASQAAAAASITAANAEIAVAEASLMASDADLLAARADTEIAQRQLEELQVSIDYATLKAPFSGIVSQRSIDPGDLIQPASGEPLFIIEQIDKVRIRIPVPESDAAMINRGDEVLLNFPSFPAEEALVASVSRLASSLDPSTRSMQVEVELDNPDRKLLPGMFGQAVITLSSNLSANLLPARAVRFDETGNAYVYVVDDQTTVSVVPVVTGTDDGSLIEITAGLTVGQQVIDSHLQRFNTGQKVRVLEN
jgi:HlyD family secretion protein